MPVVFNEPLSFLQRIAEYLEYCDLLRKASECQDPIERLEVMLVIIYADQEVIERINLRL